MLGKYRPAAVRSFGPLGLGWFLDPSKPVALKPGAGYFPLVALPFYAGSSGWVLALYFASQGGGPHGVGR